MALESNPFAALSLIVAPAILTNACSVLILSTSNRFARAVDRARQLAQEIEASDDLTGSVASRRLRELTTTETRSLLVLRAMRSCYVALSGFALAALVSLLGAVLLHAGSPLVVGWLETLALGAGGVAVAALIHASVLLVRDTQLAVGVLQERAAGLRSGPARATRRRDDTTHRMSLRSRWAPPRSAIIGRSVTRWTVVRAMELTVRDAEPADAGSLVRVLNPIIKARVYTAFDTPFSIEAERTIRWPTHRGSVIDETLSAYHRHDLRPGRRHAHVRPRSGMASDRVRSPVRRRECAPWRHRLEPCGVGLPIDTNEDGPLKAQARPEDASSRGSPPVGTPGGSLAVRDVSDCQRRCPATTPARDWSPKGLCTGEAGRTRPRWRRRSAC